VYACLHVFTQKTSKSTAFIRVWFEGGSAIIASEQILTHGLNTSAWT